MKRFMVLFFGLFLVKAIHAQTLTINELYGFACPNSVCPEGAGPGPLLQASDGNFYGGTGTQGGIFQITPAGQLTVLHAFTQDHKTGHYDEGQGPIALVEASDGYLYGINSSGGPNPDSSGTLFKLSKTGANFQVLQVFCTVCTTGSNPTSLSLGSDGNIYGTTNSGGIVNNPNICQGLGCGVVFQLTPPGTFTVLHALNGSSDSSYPLGVILASDANLYGTTGNYHPGTVFRVSPVSGQFTTIYNFPKTSFPIGGVVQLANGLLYGVSQPAKGVTGNPAIFSSTLSGSVKTVATSPISVRNNYYSPILQATDGNLWTTAYYTTSNTLSVGAALAFNPKNGALEQELFFNKTIGIDPWSGLLQTTDGTLYGTAASGGTDASGNLAYGTIYTITGLPPK